MADDLVRNHENNGPGLKLLRKKVEKLMERVEDLDAIINNASSIMQQVISRFFRLKSIEKNVINSERKFCRRTDTRTIAKIN